MLGRTERKRGIQFKPDAAVGVGGEFCRGIPFPFGGVERDEVPDENVDPQSRPAVDECAQEWAKLFGQAVIRPPRGSDQPGLAMDIPTDDVDEILRLEQHRAQSRKICGSIV
ncbi:hypothetical protein [Bradyrhizobium nanningense]|uniref:hypothetical protein n=1 Tax=Bradyrhizobium nanningense TaxID=1325118 RepID=UPI001FE20580|nr:hypothetical protein [Bradyrhizobium nanningense]